MPAKNLHRIDDESTYFHIYNRGTEAKIIFTDRQDYEVFLGFLKDYLTAPGNPESAKKDFTVKGRIYRGTPHQPKNYVNKVDLVAYSLMPNAFHLLLHQKTRGSIQSFIRSLCTRYSMYFNKKYQRSGALFQGPYKSIQVTDDVGLLHLTRYFHNPSANQFSSYSEYLGKTETPWVKPKVVQSFFENVKTDFLKTDSYEDFVERYEPNKEEEELLERITFEDVAHELERRIPERETEQLSTDSRLELSLAYRVPEFVAVFIVFFILLGLGVRNINISKAKVLSSSTQSTPPPTTPTPLPKALVTIKITDGAETVNIRQKPEISSEKIGQARDGDTFEFVSLNSDWYEVKLADSATGYISATYAYLGGESK